MQEGRHRTFPPFAPASSLPHILSPSLDSSIDSLSLPPPSLASFNDPYGLPFHDPHLSSSPVCTGPPPLVAFPLPYLLCSTLSLLSSYPTVIHAHTLSILPSDPSRHLQPSQAIVSSWGRSWTFSLGRLACAPTYLPTSLQKTTVSRDACLSAEKCFPNLKASSFTYQV